MYAVQLQERCEKILRILVAGSSYTTISSIIGKTGVSRRSIYYDLCRINEWLGQYGIEELQVERGKGIYLSPEKKESILQILEEGPEDTGYVFQPSERVKVIISCIIYSEETVYAERLMEECQISRNTLFGDLKAVTSALREHGLDLTYEAKKGYKITGDVIRVRALFFYYYHDLRTLYENGILHFFDREEAAQYYARLQAVEKELGTDYVEGSLNALAALLPIMYRNRGELTFAGLRETEIRKKREFGAVERHFGDLPEQEKIYLCLHLLGSRVTFIAEDLFDDAQDQPAYEITKALVTEFEKTACVEFENREGLERALFVHISTSMYRYQYGIQMGNEISEDVQREYPNLFALTRVASRYLEQMTGYPVNDGEIAYLALHFGAYLKISRPESDTLRILLVCVNGVSTGNMLRREISALLPEAQIVDVRSADDMTNAQNLCDVIISTIRVNSIVPDIVVHAVLTDEDRGMILNHPIIAGHRSVHLGNALFDSLKKYVSKENEENLRRDILDCLQGSVERHAVPDVIGAPGLAAMLTPDHITIQEGGGTWRAAIRAAGKPLLETGSIEPRYLDTIIDQTGYYGPYMFITDHIMLAHAKPEAGVKHLDLSLAIFRAPVFFQENRRARLLFVLAPSDQETHLRILEEIFRIASTEEYVECLCGTETPEEASIFLRKLAGAAQDQ